MLPTMEVFSGSADAGSCTVIAQSSVTKEKLHIVDHISRSDSLVLMLGERGVGKKTFAVHIHRLSERRGKTFVCLHCAVIGGDVSADFLEDEVFPFAKGGTLFFDEVTALPFLLQERLLSVLQRQSFDVRCIASSSVDIEKLALQGSFHSGLYHRLNVLPLCIPPLRQRTEDIPELAAVFLRAGMAETGKRFDGFSEEAVKALCAYPWMGNTAELESCIKRACFNGKNTVLEKRDIFPSSVPAFDESKPAGKTLKDVENMFRKRYLVNVLSEHKWNQTETAKVLGIQRTYLSKLIKELDINGKE